MMANYTMTIQEMLNDELINGIFPKNYLFYVDDAKAQKEFERSLASFDTLFEQLFGIQL